MLILTRKMGETITIGENIQISVLNIKGGQVRVGIDAPQDVKINREEVFERLQKEDLKKEAADHADAPTDTSNSKD